MFWMLIVVTFLGGNAPGPVVHTQMLASEAQCIVARDAVLAQVDEMSKTNMTAYAQTEKGVTGMGRKMAQASCAYLPKR